MYLNPTNVLEKLLFLRTACEMNGQYQQLKVIRMLMFYGIVVVAVLLFRICRRVVVSGVDGRDDDENEESMA